MPRTTEIDRTLLRDALLTTLTPDGAASTALAQEVGDADRVADVEHDGPDRIRVRTALGAEWIIDVRPATGLVG